ncbi:MAG TPA: DinB family protein [Thermoanaerobaculia bacterium]|nr:DinB family protein [Thermoanaerobaculia bacterium]
MTVDEIRGLYDYNQWAHSRMFAVIRELSDEQYTRVLTSSYPTIRETLTHIVFAEWLWLQRWKGNSPTEQPAWCSEPDAETLEKNQARGAEERRKLLDALDDAALEKPIAYRNMKGDPFTNRLADILIHVVNHASYHRGQLTTMLRQAGATPPSTDLIVYRRA